MAIYDRTGWSEEDIQEREGLVRILIQELSFSPEPQNQN